MKPETIVHVNAAHDKALRLEAVVKALDICSLEAGHGDVGSIFDLVAAELDAITEHLDSAKVPRTIEEVEEAKRSLRRIATQTGGETR